VVVIKVVITPPGYLSSVSSEIGKKSLPGTSPDLMALARIGTGEPEQKEKDEGTN
jgi:hypothetical protein